MELDAKGFKDIDSLGFVIWCYQIALELQTELEVIKNEATTSDVQY